VDELAQEMVSQYYELKKQDIYLCFDNTRKKRSARG
jgi:hypothetical protein